MKNLSNIFLGQIENFESFLHLWVERHPNRGSNYLGEVESSEEKTGKVKKTVTIEIFDIIGGFFGFGMSPTRFSGLLKQAVADGADQVKFDINSPGGLISDGITIFNLADQFPLPTITRNMGMAASMAAVFMQAGDVRQMFDNTLSMVHNPTGLAFGNSKDLLKEVKVLDKMRNTLSRTFSNRTGLDENKIKEMFDDEVFMEAEEALELNFIDEILPSKEAAQSLEAVNSKKIIVDFIDIRPIKEQANVEETCSDGCKCDSCQSIIEKAESKLGLYVNCSDPDECGVVSLPEVESVESIDEGSRKIKVQFITSGWSSNGGGYPASYFPSLATQMMERRKMYIGHKMKGTFKDKLSRDPQDWIATIDRVWEGIDSRTGRPALKGEIQCTALPYGEAMLQQAKLDPSSVRISIHTIDYINPKGSLLGKIGEVHEECKFQFSADWVSYDAANGKALEVAASLGTGTDLHIEDYGIYEFINQTKRGESKMKYEYNTANEAAKNGDIVDAVLEVALSDEVIGEASVYHPFEQGKRIKISELQKLAVEGKSDLSELSESHESLKKDHAKSELKIAQNNASKLEGEKEDYLQKALAKKKLVKDTFGKFLSMTALEQKSDSRPEDYESLSKDEQAKFRTWGDKIDAMVAEFSNGIEKDRKLRAKSIDTSIQDNWSEEENEEQTETATERDTRLAALI